MKNNSKEIELSILIPCFNSEKSITELTDRLIATLTNLGVSYEIIFVNDGSLDNTLTRLIELHERYSQITVIDLMNNVGQFRALMCGFEHTRGQYVLTMDDDLQHPPEEIPWLYSHLQSRPDLDGVLGSYDSKKHSLVRNLGTKMIHRLDKKIFGKSSNIELTSFRCLRRELVNTIIENRTYFPLLGPIIKKSSYRLENITVHHDERQYGNSNYSFTDLVKTTYNYVFNYSSIPLKYISILGAVMAVVSIILVLFYIIRYLLGEVGVSGWTTIVLLLNFYSGLILLSISVIGEYLIRILNEVSGQPRFKIRQVYRK